MTVPVQQLGQLLTGTIPIVGQSLSDAAGTVLSGIQLLKSGLGFAAIVFLAAEFLPLYMILMVHTVLLFGCEPALQRRRNQPLRRPIQLFARSCTRAGGSNGIGFLELRVLGTALLFMVGGG